MPGIITSDRGPQFVSQWWETMCTRLGVHGVFSQAHRHQANGRAEVAGRVLQDLLRKLMLDHELNWVETLPRALRIHHDTLDPIMGMTPYQIMFGRDRALGGVPGDTEKECTEAQEFFDKMEEIDKLVAGKMQQAHDKVARQVNAHRHKRPPL